MSANVRELLFLLPRYKDTEVLLVSEQDGYALPIYDQRVPPNVGFEEPAPYNAWFANRFGLEVLRRYALDHEGSDCAVFVLESPIAESSAPDGTSWVRAQDVSSIPFASEDHRAFLQAWFAPSPESVTMPWAAPRGYEEAFAWMHRKLDEQGVEPLGTRVQVKNAYVSSVFRCSTSLGDVYLKVLPNLFNRESQILAKLTEWGIAELPERLATDTSRGYLLTRDMGGFDLSESLSLDLLAAAVQRFAEFQVSSSHLVDVANPWPFFDMRIPVMCERIDSVVDEIPDLLRGSPYGFREDEIQRLRERLPFWKALCGEIQELGLPDALDHGDLRPGNIRVLPDRLIFYDWAWSAITHPFLSVVGFLHIVRSYLEDTAGSSEKLHDAYLEAWTSFAPARDLRRAFDLADQLKALYGTIGDAAWVREILQALPDGTPSDTHPDSWTLRRRQYYFAKMARRLL